MSLLAAGRIEGRFLRCGTDILKSLYASRRRPLAISRT